jgi:hypothetical protein
MFNVPRHVLNYIHGFLSDMIAYASLSDGSLSKAIEVMEEFLDTDLSLEDLSLHALFNVQFDVNHICWLSDTESAQVGRRSLSDL